MQQAYEDRISALRAQVDRITSRQLLDQQVMETKVCELLERQTQLSRRHGRLGPLLERAESEVGKTLPDAVHAPGQRPDDRSHATIDAGTPQLASLSAGVEARPLRLLVDARPAPQTESAADRADKLFMSINRSLPQHRERADRPADAAGGLAYENAGRRSRTRWRRRPAGGGRSRQETNATWRGRWCRSTRPPCSTPSTRTGRGARRARQPQARGPPPARWPIRRRAWGASPFGVRTDPLLGTAALHSGMDFRAPPACRPGSRRRGRRHQGRWNGG